MEKYELELGDEVQDTVTGIKGIATSKTEFLNGCIQVEVTPKVKQKGNLNAESAFGIAMDIQQLKRVGCGINKKVPIKKSSSGGPMRMVPRRAY